MLNLEPKIVLLIFNIEYLVIDPPDLLPEHLLLFPHLLLVLFAGLGPIVFIAYLKMIILTADLAPRLPSVKFHIHHPFHRLKVLRGLPISYVH